MSERPQSSWEAPEVVEQFANRDPDHRLRALVENEGDDSRLRVLDVGCAGGRNTVYLAEHGHDVFAIDLSVAMVDETRRRLGSIIGDDLAQQRVTRSRMDDLSSFGDESFDLVLALGIYHQAESVAEWEKAVSESVRVLRRGGQLLVAHFAPGTDLTGDGGCRVEGELDLYELQPGRCGVLFNAERLDTLMRRHGLAPDVATETVRRPREEGGMRVTVNGLYRKE